jgi:dihydrofolate reductase
LKTPSDHRLAEQSSRRLSSDLLGSAKPRSSAGADDACVAELRQQDGGTIGTAGSPSLVRSLIAHGLLGELTLMISPVVAGGGRKRLFPEDTAATKFELVEGQPASSGALIATYRPIR